MPIIINQIKSAVNESEENIISKAIKFAGTSKNEVVNAQIHKTSLDARKQNDIHFVHSVYLELSDSQLEKKLSEKSQCMFLNDVSFKPEISRAKKDGKICIAGFGPAGIFCALVLAENGFDPLVIERGEDVESRTNSVKNYWNGGTLNTQSNVQFGEGGAGTFSDGKLTTRIKDPLCRYVLEKFVEHGAPEEILTKAKPHIGTDKLRLIVKSMREKIIELGGEVKFSSQLDDFSTQNGKVTQIKFNGNSENCSELVLATGHSARDTFEMLLEKGIFIEPKAFSVGARIEHKQIDVEKSLYGKHAGNPLLPKGEYQLSYRKRDSRAAYTFCMCPGGTVVPSASEENTIVTNGMSEYARNGENANCALVVSVTPSDFGTKPLDGMYFSRNIEKKAYQATGGSKAPATTVDGLMYGKANLDTSITPTYARGITACNFNEIFPSFVTDMMIEGLHDFSRKMKCFGDKSALLTGPETRTSSPVRITRTENLNSISISNLYPCGEGAGYAGGIISAAVDGIKIAMKIMSC